MRQRILVLAVVLFSILGGTLTFPWLTAQEKSSPIQPVSATKPSSATAETSSKPATLLNRLRELNLPDQAKQNLLMTQRACEWLFRMNQADGRFSPGLLPSLNRWMENDSFLNQAMASLALAQTARFSGDEKHLVRAKQAVMTLLLQTESEAGMRWPRQPSLFCNRLASAGLLAAAIYHQPEISAKLAQEAEELCQFLAKQQKADGSLHYADDPKEEIGKTQPQGVNVYPGQALYGMAMSLRLKSADWKVAVLKKALPYYRKVFQTQPNPDLACWMSLAFAEAFVSTKEEAFASFVCELNDWVLKLQYDQLDPRHPEWRGGFRMNKESQDAPTMESAMMTWSLVEACRTIRYMSSPDVQRYQQYRVSVQRGISFLGMLQFNEGNTAHFTGEYRPLLIGGFHVSNQDGNIRVDQTAKAICACIGYLQYTDPDKP